MQNSSLKYWKRVLVAIDQFGNTICGGNEDSTISATVGYYSLDEGSFFWTTLEQIIDFTFYPVDYKGHCLKAYRADPNEDYRIGSKWALFVIAVLFCVPIGLILWTIHILK